MTLNSLLSAWLLQEESPQISMSSLLQKAGLIYDYLGEKSWVKTYMTVKPMQVLVEKHIAGLGFKIEKAKKDLIIKLDHKEQDWRCKLILAYYSGSLIPAFLLEGCLSTLIKSAMSRKSYELGESVAVALLFKIVRFYADLFQNESLTNYQSDPDVIMQRMAYFDEKGLVKLSADQKSVCLSDRENSIVMLNFFSQLIIPLIDTYLIVLTTLEQLCGKNLVIKKSMLAKELHLGIKYLYSKGCLPALHSCLKETIITAITRFS